jgi:hypothetical protein
MLFTSDGTTINQYQLDITAQAFMRLSTQPIANVQIVLLSNPMQLIAVTNTAPWQVLLYNVFLRNIVARGAAIIAPDQPTHLTPIGQWPWSGIQTTSFIALNSIVNCFYSFIIFAHGSHSPQSCHSNGQHDDHTYQLLWCSTVISKSYASLHFAGFTIFFHSCFVV